MFFCFYFGDGSFAVVVVVDDCFEWFVDCHWMVDLFYLVVFVYDEGIGDFVLIGGFYVGGIGGAVFVDYKLVGDYFSLCLFFVLLFCEEVFYNI